MSESAAEARQSEAMREAIEPDGPLARKNARWAWSLVVMFLVLFGGTFGVAYAYLWLK